MFTFLKWTVRVIVTLIFVVFVLSICEFILILDSAEWLTPTNSTKR